jgi:hypothetical protein
MRVIFGGAIGLMIDGGGVVRCDGRLRIFEIGRAALAAISCAGR